MRWTLSAECRMTLAVVTICVAHATWISGEIRGQAFDPFGDGQPSPPAASNDPSVPPYEAAPLDPVPSDEPVDAGDSADTNDPSEATEPVAPPTSVSNGELDSEAVPIAPGTPTTDKPFAPIVSADDPSVNPSSRRSRPLVSAAEDPASPTSQPQTPQSQAPRPTTGRSPVRGAVPPSSLREDSTTGAASSLPPATSTPSMSNLADSVPSDVRASGFEDITPGESTVAQVIEKLGEPKTRGRKQTTESLIYQIGPFPKVEFLVIDDVVETIIVYLAQPADRQQLAKDLQLETFEPAPVPDTTGRVLGIAYPERGVLFAFSAEGEDKIAQVVLEPIAPEPFINRAEFDGRHRYSRNMRDLNYALQLNTKDADAHWLRGRILARLNDPAGALADVERAVRLAPDSPNYRLTRARLLADNGRHDEAEREVKAVAAMKNATAADQARAELLYGDLLAQGPRHDYQQAIEHHMAAINLATKLAKSGNEGARPVAQQILLDAHISAAHDIASGRWRRKQQVADSWLGNARTIAEAMSKERADDYFNLLVDCQTLAAYEAIGDVGEVADLVERTIARGREMLAAADDPLYQQCLEWELGEALIYAAAIEHRRGDQAAALKYAENANALLQSQVETGRLTSRTQYLLGKLRFLIGANHAVFKEDHAAAIEWYEQALPLLPGTPPVEFSHQLGTHGERFVSMGVSFWVAEQRQKAIELTQQGLGMMRKAVESQGFDATALSVPYNNLAGMYRQVGDDEKADAYQKAIRSLKTAENPGSTTSRN